MAGDMERYGFVRLHAREGEEGAVEEALWEVMAASRTEAGCLDFHIFRSMRDRRLFFIHSKWKDDTAFAEHGKLAHTLRFLERVDCLVDEPRQTARTEKIG
jgi:quinol monooxygenase YgiN